MLTFEKLIQTPEYWMETIQNELYRQVKKFLDEKGITQTQLAKNLKVTKGYISQVLNGNFNFTLSKLIELSLAVGVVPDLEFRSFADYAAKELKSQYDVDFVIPANQPAVFEAVKSESTALVSIGKTYISHLKIAN
jgi:transcriptional regulator with XRE-family HTH domain